MTKLGTDGTPGQLSLIWKERELTAPGGGILRIHAGERVMGSDTASWRRGDDGEWVGRWADIPASLTWAILHEGKSVIWSVSVRIEEPFQCDRLELVLPLVPRFHAWRVSGLRGPSELLDPGIFGERYNLDFMALRSSGFFNPRPSGSHRYHALTSSPRPGLQAGSFDAGWPMVTLEALNAPRLSAVASSPEDGGRRELILLARPGSDSSADIHSGHYRLKARITVRRRPGRWIDEILRGQLDAVGAATGKVLQGPLEVQISPTNRCNQSCVACWCHAPFRRGEADYAAWASKSMDMQFFERLIEKVALGGTPIVSLIGSGDPLMHRDIVKMIRMVKDRGMRCRLNTNGLLLNPELNRELVRLGLDRLHVSLWTSRQDIYARLHPGKRGSVLAKIEECLRDLTRVKRAQGSQAPFLEIFHSISKENVDEIDGLIEQAERVGANSIFIRPLSVIPGRTERLLPTDRDIALIRHRLEAARKRIEGSMSLRTNFGDYMEQVSAKGAAEGRYHGHHPTAPCYIGWAYAIIHTNGAMSPCCLGEPLLPPLASPDDFLNAWTSGALREFREKSLNMAENSDYFIKRIPCFTECCMEPVNGVVGEGVKAIKTFCREVPRFERRLRKIAKKAEGDFLRRARAGSG